jgi:hypothetical protein
MAWTLSKRRFRLAEVIEQAHGGMGTLNHAEHLRPTRLQ